MSLSLDEYKQRLSLLSIKDEKRLRRDLTFIEKRQQQNQLHDKKLSQFEDQVLQAVDFLVAKQQSIPEISFPEALPVSQKKDEIAELIENNQVVILAGETGSGKTTQIPKICLSLGRGLRGKIGHTQPRRIAARTVASRIAEELKCELGTAVGYQVRFTDHTNDNTFVKLMTDGILLTEIQRDPLLLDYDTLIIDEAHERSLNIDFLLGYLKRLLPQRPDLKLIVTSATIDLERFSKHFEQNGKAAPVIEVSGRTFPVETHYRPWQDEFEDINEAIVASVEEFARHYPPGDILIFLPGERDIREASHALKKSNTRLEILPLYARLSLADQNKIFHGSTGRRVILATNVAETSITVPGIKYVIDPGYARISRYSVKTKVQRLPIEAISQASANQRQGRCGRVSDGVCFRLYEKEDFDGRPEFTDAEILRTNLAAVILQMLQMHIGDVREFPFVDKPDRRLINDGFKLLEEIKAVSPNGKLTPLGRQISQLPIDPRLAAVIIEAGKLGCLEEILIIVSVLSIQDPRERPAEKQQASDEKHRRFWDEDSDFIAYVNLWNYFEEQRQELSQSQLRSLCKREFINFMRMREWRELHHQLKLSIKPLNLKSNTATANYESIHRALICGYLSHIGQKDQESKSREYYGTRQKKFLIFPGSSQSKKKHLWVLAAEFIDTSQLFGHTIAKIQPEWILDYCDHLAKRHYFEPYYDVKAGQVQGFVRTTLLGLVVQEKKRVAYKQVDEKQANEIFVREALVEGKYRGNGTFFKYNQTLVKEVHELEAKSRRRDIMVDDEVVFNFYRSIVPPHISNLKGFEHWRKETEIKDAKRLFLDKSTLMLHDAEHVSQQQFPNVLVIGDYTLALKYCFEPGKEQDGVNLQVPVEVLHDIPAERLDWLVPGLLRDKCIALVKGLPKATRKHFVPVPAKVEQVLPRLKSNNSALVEALGEALGHFSEAKIPLDQWEESNLDDFYRMNIQVVDDKGKVIDQSRDLSELKSKYRARVQKTISKVGGEIERENITSWDFGKLAESIQLDKGQVKIKAYPALIAKADSVELKVMDNPAEANYASSLGVLRLAQREIVQSNKYLKRALMKGKDIGLTQVSLGKREEVIDELILTAIKASMFKDEALPRDEAQFKACIEAGKSRVVEAAEKYEDLLARTLAHIVSIKKQIKTHKNPLVIAMAANDVQQQLSQLVYKGFLLQTPWQWLSQYPRYLRGIELRIEKFGQNPNRDNAWIRELQDYWQKHEARLDSEGLWAYQQNEAWQKYRWMLEELRVSYFAQSLKTLMPVSGKRLEKIWQESQE
ncbi:MAG: ATP-dependent RNA helicase HrpA [Agarilytica sp.]